MSKFGNSNRVSLYLVQYAGIGDPKEDGGSGKEEWMDIGWNTKKSYKKNIPLLEISLKKMK